MAGLHTEIHFESEICARLAEQGWLYADNDAAQFDRTHGLFPPDLLAWIEATQPDAWTRLTKTHGAALPRVLAERYVFSPPVSTARMPARPVDSDVA